MVCVRQHPLLSGQWRDSWDWWHQLWSAGPKNTLDATQRQTLVDLLRWMWATAGMGVWVGDGMDICCYISNSMFDQRMYLWSAVKVFWMCGNKSVQLLQKHDCWDWLYCIFLHTVGRGKGTVQFLLPGALDAMVTMTLLNLYLLLLWPC